MAARRGRNRNRRLLQAELAESPYDAERWFNLGKDLTAEDELAGSSQLALVFDSHSFWSCSSGRHFGGNGGSYCRLTCSHVQANG